MLVQHKDTIYSEEFNDKRAEYDEACRWLESEFGIKYKKNRYGEYAKELQKFINPNNSMVPKDDQIIEKFHTFIQSTTEAYQLIRLWRTFSEDNFDGLKERIKKVIKGQASRAKAIEKKNDIARDFAFELNVASRFHKAGFPIILNDITDVIVELNKDKLFVECKRVISEEKLYIRVKQAVKQVDTRIGSNRKGKFGFVAIDVTDLINPNQKFHVVSSPELFSMNVKELIQQFVLNRKEKLLELMSRNIVGIMFEYSSSGFITGSDESAIGYSRCATVLHKSEPAKNGKILSQFYSKIGNQNL